MSLEARTYRDIWGGFATGVTVITTDCDGWLHGMTANGVTSVSIDPLLMLVCVDKEARCHEQLSKAGRFGVSLLAADQEEIANIFAKGEDPEEGTMRGVDYHLGPHGTPLIDGGIGYLECRVHDILEGGDHDIFVGEALGGEIARPEAGPLLFFRGRYGRLA